MLAVNADVLATLVVPPLLLCARSLALEWISVDV
jgi:hypothetical protein